MEKLAIYDIDFTIIEKDSLISFIFFLIKKRPLKLIYLPSLLIITLLRLFRVISMERFKSAWLIFLAGYTPKEVEKVSKEFYESLVAPAIKSQVLPQIRSLKKKGYKIVLATASFDIYMKYLAEKIEPDYFFATRIGNKNKRYGIIGKNCKGKEKIKRILKKIPKESIDKRNSVAFSDSKSDLPFLEIVDTLYMVKKKEWDIYDTLKAKK